MNTAREVAYRVQSGALDAGRVRYHTARLAEDISACSARRIHCRPDRASGGQNHRRRGGNGPFCRVHARVAVCGCLSLAKPKRRGAAQSPKMVLMAGAKLATDNVFRLELANGSRVLALPGTQESIRGHTVDSWIVADEAAQLDPDIMAALHPMRTQRPNARFAMLSTAWSRTDPFWSVWENDDPSWTRIRATDRRGAQLDRPQGLGKSATPTQCR